MSTRYDILEAKRIFESHCGTHGCSAGKCVIRTALWSKYVGGPKSAAARWGIEPGDEERQERQYLTLHAA
jgi:hypothetical protein